jgi:hypothetical protein
MKKSIFLIPLFFICCKQGATELVFPFEKKLFADKVEIKELISPDFMVKSGEHIAISSSVTDPMMYLYSIPSMTFESSFIRKGRGPNEIPHFPMFCKNLDNNDYVYIWGYTPITIKKLFIDNLNNPRYEKEFHLSRYEAFNYMSVLRDSLFLYFLPDDLTIKKYDLVNNTYLDEINFDKDNHKESYFFSNRGMMDANAEKIVYSYIFKKQIDIFNISTMKRVARIKAGRQTPLPSLDFNNITQHYINLYAGQDYFYALYDGSQNSSDIGNSTLEVFEYNGTPVAKYMFDIVPYLFVVNEENRNIYGYNPIVAPGYLLKFEL